MKRTTEIKVTHFTQVDSEDLNELIDLLSKKNSRVTLVAKDPGPQMAFEWVLPSAVTIIIGYVGQRVLDGFLEEFGGDIHRAMKNAVVKVYEKVTGKNLRWGSRSKGSEGPRVTSISINMEVDERKTVARFVFPQGLTREQVGQAMQGIPYLATKVRDKENRRHELYDKARSATEPEEASRLMNEFYNDYVPDQAYAFSPDRQEWVNIYEEIMRIAEEQTAKNQADELLSKKRVPKKTTFKKKPSKKRR